MHMSHYLQHSVRSKGFHRTSSLLYHSRVRVKSSHYMQFSSSNQRIGSPFFAEKNPAPSHPRILLFRCDKSEKPPHISNNTSIDTKCSQVVKSHTHCTKPFTSTRNHNEPFCTQSFIRRVADTNFHIWILAFGLHLFSTV